MYLVLGEGQNWGPSIMLSRFVMDMPHLVSTIEGMQGALLGRYWEGEQYDLEELRDKGLAIFRGVENTWKYMLKHSTQKYPQVSIQSLRSEF